jgi:transcriptional regulator GlxA family with amidase domain
MAQSTIDPRTGPIANAVVALPSHGANRSMVREIGFVLSRGFSPLGLSASSVFQAANELLGHDYYRVQFVSNSGQPICGDGDVLVATQRPETQAYDTLFVIGPADLPLTYASEDVTFLQKAARRSRRMVASGTAAFPFAEAGILDGFRATTHWSFTDEFRARYPEVLLDDDCIYVSDRNMWTSAGMTADVDVALALVEEDLGAPLARDIARKLVVYYRRPAGHPQASFLVNAEPRTGRIKRVLAYARANLQKALSVEELADIAHLSPRQFSRLFRDETGQSPARAIEAMRVELAKAILKGREMPVDSVARYVGFNDRSRMRRAFARSFGISPVSMVERGAKSIERNPKDNLPSSTNFANAF